MGYKINNKEYEDVFALGKEMFLFSDLAAKELRKEPLLDFIRSQDEKKYEKVRKLSLLSIPDDVFVFKVSYVLNPYMSLRMKGYCFDDYVSLGEAMLASAPRSNPVFMELMRYQLISEQMKSTFYDTDHPSVYRKTLELERIGVQDSLYAYFCLAYYLSHKTTIIYDGVEYQDIFNFTYFLCKKEKDLDGLGESLTSSPLLRAYSQFNKDGTDIDAYFHLCRENSKSERALNEFLKQRKENNA